MYGGLTVTVHGAVGAGLLAVALDFFASTLIASTGHPPPLLHRERGLELLGIGRSLVFCGEVLGARKIAIVIEIAGIWRGILLA